MSNFSTAQLNKEFIEIDGKKMAFHQSGEGYGFFSMVILLLRICGET